MIFKRKMLLSNTAMVCILLLFTSISMVAAISAPNDFEDDYGIQISKIDQMPAANGVKGFLTFTVKAMSEIPKKPLIACFDFNAGIFSNTEVHVIPGSETRTWEFSVEYTVPSEFSGSFGITACCPNGSNTGKTYFYRNILSVSSEIKILPFSPSASNSVLDPRVRSSLYTSPRSAANQAVDSAAHLMDDKNVSALTDVINIAGHATYWSEPDNSEKPLAGVEVKLWDRDYTSSDDYLASFTTDQQGYYSVVNIDRTDSDEGGAVDVYATVSFTNDSFSIKNEQAEDYQVSTSPLTDIASGSSTINIYLDSSNTLAPLGCIFTAMKNAVDYLSGLSVARETIKVVWPSNESTTYEFGYSLPGGAVISERINIAAYSQWKKASVQHEYGHAVMMHLYGSNYNNWPIPSSASPSPHYVNTESSGEFALKEGFAEFFPCMVNSSALQLKQYSNTDTPNIETNDWWKGSGTNTDGSIVEGSVASIFWDMIDNNTMEGSSSPDDDSLSNLQSKIFAVMSEYKPASITAFWDSWILKGYGSVTELKAVFSTHKVSVTLPANNIPTVMVTAPAVSETPTSPYTITWNSYDGDGDSLLVSLFYDNDNNPGSEKLIVENIENTGSYVWDFSGVDQGVYYIKAVVADNKGGTGDDWSSGTLAVNYNSNPPVIKKTIPTLYAAKNSPIVIDLTPYESDSEDTDPKALTWSVSQYDNCTVTGENSSDDLITLTPTTDFVGADEVYFVLSDSGGKTASQLVRAIWTDSSLKALDISNFTFSHTAHPAYPITDLNDGQKNYQQDFAANIKTAQESSMILDLGADRLITGLVIYNDGEYGAEKAVVELSSSDTPEKYAALGEFSDLLRTPSQPSENKLYISPCFGRYLKITFSGFHSSGWFQLNEIEVKGFEPVSPGNASIESIVSNPGAVSGRGTDRLTDGITIVNGDYAVINNRENVILTFDLGQTTEVFGFNIVNDSIYGASSVKLGSTPLSSADQAVTSAFFDDLVTTQNQAVDNRRYFNMVTARFITLEFSDFSHTSYFQLNEVSFISQGTATGGTGITKLEVQHSTCDKGSYPGFDITKIHDGLKQFNSDFVVRNSSQGVEITLDLGADKSINEIRHYNDGQYGATAVTVKYAAQGASSYTDLASYNSLAVSPSVVNQNIFSFQAVTARYVKFSYTSFNDSSWFQLNEIEVYGGSDQASGPENEIEISKVTSSATEFPGYEASHLYNGLKVYNSDYAVANSGAQVDLVADLGSDRTFNTVKIYNDGLFGAKSIELFKASAAAPDTYESIRAFSPLKAVQGKSTENILTFNEVTARYIMIRATAFYSPSWYQLNEIEVYKSSDTSSGLINPVGVSLFNGQAWPGFEETKIIDGMKNYNNDFACRNYGTSLYLTFDLGDSYSVTGISHVNDGEYGAKSVLVKYSTAVSPDVFITVKTFSGLSGTPDSPNENILTFDAAVEAKYIKLEYTEFHNSSWFQLNEVEFYGTQASSSKTLSGQTAADISGSAAEVSYLLTGQETFEASKSALTPRASAKADSSSEAVSNEDAYSSSESIPGRGEAYIFNELFNPLFSARHLSSLQPEELYIKVQTFRPIRIQTPGGFTKEAWFRLYTNMGYILQQDKELIAESSVLDSDPLMILQSAAPELIDFTRLCAAEHSVSESRYNPDKGLMPVYTFDEILFALENYIDCFSDNSQSLDEKYIRQFIESTLYASEESEGLKKLWIKSFTKIMKCRQDQADTPDSDTASRACKNKSRPTYSRYSQVLLRAFMFLPALMEANYAR